MTIISIEKKKKKMHYLRKVQQEIKKVSWTSKKELFLSGKIVIISLFVFGLGIYSMDMIIRNFLGFLHRIFSYIGG